MQPASLAVVSAIQRRSVPPPVAVVMVAVERAAPARQQRCAVVASASATHPTLLSNVKCATLLVVPRVAWAPAVLAMCAVLVALIPHASAARVSTSARHSVQAEFVGPTAVALSAYPTHVQRRTIVRRRAFAVR